MERPYPGRSRVAADGNGGEPGHMSGGGARTRAPEPIPAPRLLAPVLPSVVVGIAVGILTSLGQRWIGHSLQSVANSAGPWSLAAFVVARRMRSMPSGAVAAAVTLATCEIGYVIANEVRDISSSKSTVVFWLVAAALAGPPLGVAAVWSRGLEPFKRGAGFGVPVGVLIGEGAYGLARLTGSTSAAYWSIEIAIGVIALGVLNVRVRSGPVAASSTVAAALTAIVVYAAAITV